MPLEDLADLGYEVYRSSDIEPPMAGVVGYGQQWNLAPGQDEEEIVTIAKNHKALYDKFTQGQSYFADAYTNWPTMTSQQKDAAMRNVQRALANLMRYARNDLTSGGV